VRQYSTLRVLCRADHTPRQIATWTAPRPLSV